MPAGSCCRGCISPRRPELVTSIASNGTSGPCARLKIGRGASLLVVSARGRVRVTFAGTCVPVFCSLRFHDLTLCPFGLLARLVSALVRAAMSFEFTFNNTTYVSVVKWVFEL